MTNRASYIDMLELAGNIRNSGTTFGPRNDTSPQTEFYILLTVHPEAILDLQPT
jgi:hypothetical protein